MNKYLIMLFLLCPLSVNAGAKSDLNKGNKAYKQEKYGQAYEYYQKAALAGQEEALYNSAAALYRLQDYGASGEDYLKVANDNMEKDSKLAQNSFYNAANAQYMNQKTKEALQSQRQAILLNMKDEAAIHNMQFMLEEQKDNNKDQQNKEGNKNAPQDNQDNNKDQNNQGSNRDNQDKQQDNQDQQQDQDKLSQQQAQDILKMIGDGEKKNTPPPLEAGNGNDKENQTQVENDW